MPKKKKPLTSADYQAKFRQKLEQDGKRSVTVFLGADAVKALAELRQAAGNNSNAVETALKVAAALLKKKKTA